MLTVKKYKHFNQTNPAEFNFFCKYMYMYTTVVFWSFHIPGSRYQAFLKTAIREFNGARKFFWESIKRVGHILHIFAPYIF
jgi:hypothetical protein